MFEFFHRLESIGSTNDYLKPFIAAGRPGAAMALEQTEGKGRHGRRWDSQRGRGAYLSMLWFPQWGLHEAEWLSRLASLAVIRALTGLPGAEKLQLQVRPPNDILTGGRKLAGILIETASQEDRIQWAIVGIGVNLSQDGFDLDRRHLQPTSLRLEGVAPPAPDSFCEILAGLFSGLHHELQSGSRRRLEQEFEAALSAPPRGS